MLHHRTSPAHLDSVPTWTPASPVCCSSSSSRRRRSAEPVAASRSLCVSPPLQPLQQGSLRVKCRANTLSTQQYEDDPDDDEDYPAEVPTTFELMQRPNAEKPTVRVRLSVHYRVHSRQMLCIGGSLIPFGWSFLSIAKVPMTWNNGDVWTCEVELQAGQRIEYKYVVLEEQDWTRIVNEESQGLVEIKYRTGLEPAQPPNVQAIQRQMAIVAWQPGPNRILHVPSEEELQQLRIGEAIERIPPLPSQTIPYRNTIKREPVQKTEPFEGTWEVLTTDAEDKPFLDRYDAWGCSNRRPPALKGLSFG
eukprot:CAMPEP_0202362156 /NCGR_PEP_ID=MMETSP1126-20121109/14434_1 /ASSEMBLY_ACC=CAM_ASM_000457 /TAXON_ID=3047 /ORGANISM="Dunaliella tertiolecta, Strain CCMP1320" /LENGTH=305 /DNA_ID=CAMNT_0048956257 /DNA_START=181 /DNA_END=1098 /DNA_ORIENTATION=+